MNNSVLFSSSAAIKIQGSHVLRLLPQNSDFIDFRIVGFDDVILVNDYRETTRHSVEQAIITGEPQLITKQFNKPADISIERIEENSLRVILEESHQNNPEYMMWINVGLKGSLPIYDYVYHRITPIENNGEFALFALYRRPPYGRSVLPMQVALADDSRLGFALSAQDGDESESSYRYGNGRKSFCRPINTNSVHIDQFSFSSFQSLDWGSFNCSARSNRNRS